MNKALITGTIVLAPGWLIPRIVGTLAFLAAPTWAGLAALLAWWLLVPLLWVIAGYLLVKYRPRLYEVFRRVKK